MDSAERDALASDLARPVSYLAGLVCGMRKIHGANEDEWLNLIRCFDDAASELCAVFEAAMTGSDI